MYRFLVDYRIPINSILFLCLIQFSCKHKNGWVDYKEIDIVRTSRDTTFFYGGKLFDGKIKKFDKNGNQLLDFNIKKGKLSGNYIEYYNNGNVKLKTNYHRGKLDGNYISYFNNQNINQETNYKEGLINGERKTYWLNGSIKESSKLRLGVITGECLFYYSNSNPRKKIMFDEFGNRDGVWIDYFQNGNIKSKIEYKSGVIIKPMLKYDINGILLKTPN